MAWRNIEEIQPHGYVCSYCGHRVGPARGFRTDGMPTKFIYVCSFCGAPTYFNTEKVQFPGPPFGNDVLSLPAGVAALYSEARSCMTVNSFTASVLTCRKLLMHIAVEKKAKEGQPFLQYVEYLADKGYVPPDGKGWVDHIRQKGNEANHEIKIMSLGDATDLITFSEMLLKFVYEFPARVQPPSASGSAS
jgi:DNA-directed RNA polymerase subunit RPC12/RpoP